MTLAIEDETPVSTNAAGLFHQPFAPDDIRLGRDLREGNQVGEYADNARLRGWLDIKSTLQLNQVIHGLPPKTVRVSPEAPVEVPKGIGAPVTVKLKVIEHEMKFDQKTFTVKPGQKVTIQFTNPILCSITCSS